MATLTTVTLCTPLNIQSLPKTHQLSKFKKQTNHVRSNACSKVSCKANDNSNNNNMDEFKLIQNPHNISDNVRHLYDRRNMLIGLGGMYGAAITLGGAPSDAVATPVAPDVTACKLIDSQWDASGCCPPKFGTNINPFKFEDYPNPVMRVRRPAHELDQDSIDDFKRATAIMKSLPLSDPRSFIQQARVHCAYCDGAYPVVDHPDQRVWVHGSWLFAPFHRWYLYFFERIMGKLINKPGFALPYWNWDHPQGMGIPSIFKDMDSPLYDPNRNLSHINKVIDLSFRGKEDEYSYEEQIEENLLLMRKQVLYPTKPSVFFGGAYRSGGEPGGAGALELAPHNNVHLWTGSNTIRDGQDMGQFWSAGRDPIFYCHHANVDRMWSVWRNDLPGRPRRDLDDQDYLNAYFVFYDENANPVKVYVKDSFDTEKLGYKYQPQELPWLFTKSREATPRKAKIVTQDIVTTFPKKLDSVIRTNIVRENNEEVLVIEFKLGMMPNSFIKFDVYVNDDYDHKPDQKTKIKPQYAGSFTMLGHRREGEVGQVAGGGETHKSALRLEITTLLEEIGATNEDTIQVTIVPKVGTESLEITGIYLQE